MKWNHCETGSRFWGLLTWTHVGWRLCLPPFSTAWSNLLKRRCHQAAAFNSPRINWRGGIKLTAAQAQMKKDAEGPGNPSLRNYPPPIPRWTGATGLLGVRGWEHRARPQQAPLCMLYWTETIGNQVRIKYSLGHVWLEATDRPHTGATGTQDATNLLIDWEKTWFVVRLKEFRSGRHAVNLWSPAREFGNWNSASLGLMPVAWWSPSAES